MEERGRLASIADAREIYAKEMERRVRIAINDIVLQGRVPSFYAVADAARVARSTLYRKSELKDLVERARRSSAEPSATVSRLEALERENALLRDELRRVRRERDEGKRVGRSRVSYWVIPFGEVA